jgi:anti-anti-sigma factor
MATAPVLRETLEQIDDHVVVDCDALTFIDSSGIGVLASQRARLHVRGYSLTLTNVGDIPRRALEIVGLLNDLT